MFGPALLLQVILYLLVLLVNDYVGFVLALILGGIGFAVWGLSHVIEWISPSRVSPLYYRLVLSAWLAPLLSVVMFTLTKGGLDWIK